MIRNYLQLGMPPMQGSGESDAEAAAFQLSQLLGSVAARAAEVSAAAQGPSALCLKYSRVPPGPAEVPWLQFASRRKPVFAWVTAAFNAILSEWRRVTAWVGSIFGGVLQFEFDHHFNLNLTDIV
jgi:hypothetical protein